MIIPLLLAILLGYFVYDIARKRAKLPPGPIPLPLIGNLHQFYWKTVQHGCIVKAMEAYKKEYGPVFTLWLGYQPTVHIGSMDLAQEMMVKRGGEYVDRWMPLLMNPEQSPYGITSNSGPVWQEQRRFSLHTLRNFGFGKNLMEERIMTELNLRTEKLDLTLKNGEGVVQVYQFINLIVGSIINRVLLSYRFEEEDEKMFFKNKGIIDKFGDIYTPTDFLMTSFWMMAIPFFRKRWGFLGNSTLELKDFFRKQIMTRVAQIESGEHVIDEEPADYVDAFIQKVQEEKDKTGSSFNLESLVMNITDIWIAGQVTTTSTLMFGLTHLLHHPEVVERIRKELQEVVGDRSLSQTDKPHTPYLVATINEVQRFASLLNINFFREQHGDKTVGGHPIASGTPITAELNMLMMDEKYFKNPREFYPDRFIEDPKLEQQVVPFGMGKRICIGESLARMELYLILGNFLLRYDIKPHGPLPNREKTNSYACFSMPHDFEMEVTKRQ